MLTANFLDSIFRNTSIVKGVSMQRKFRMAVIVLIDLYGGEKFIVRNIATSRKIWALGRNSTYAEVRAKGWEYDGSKWVKVNGGAK